MYHLKLISTKSHRERQLFVPLFNRSSYIILQTQTTLHVVTIQRKQILIYMSFFSPKVQIKGCILKGDHGRYCLPIFWIHTPTRGKINCFLVVFIKSLVKSSAKSCQFKKFQSQITIYSRAMYKSTIAQSNRGLL